MKNLAEIAKELVGNDKGLLAMDESNPTCNHRFTELGIPATLENRRAYRELILTTSGLEDYISGVILYEETVHQNCTDGKPFLKIIHEKGILAGIKLDQGTIDMPEHPGEKITEGLIGLEKRIKEYKGLGIHFAKWRAVFSINKNRPSQECIQENTRILAEYALKCQEGGLVPMVEPEVLMEGNHSIHDCFKASQNVLETLFYQLSLKKIYYPGLILKFNMILPGLDSSHPESDATIAEETVNCLVKNVLESVSGIAFLSGGQTPEQASSRLNLMNLNHKNVLPWPLTFSFSRGLQEPCLKIWKGQKENSLYAQKSLLHRAKCNHAALNGNYNSILEMEQEK